MESQENDPASVLSFYRAMIALRRDETYHDTFVYGGFEPLLGGEHDLMAYCRSGDRDTLVIANFSGKERTVRIPYRCRKVLLNNYEQDPCGEDGALALRPFQFAVMEVTR